MNITITDLANKQTFIIPIVPPDTKIVGGGNNETIGTLNGDVRFTGNRTLRKLAWGSIFPVNKNYPYVATGSDTDGNNYVNFLEDMSEKKLPVRVVVTSPEKASISNLLMTIDSFEYHLDKAGDIEYSIDLTEFPSKNWTIVDLAGYIPSYLKTVSVQETKKNALKSAGLLQ